MDARTPKAEAEDRHRAIAEMVRDFAATEIKPRAAALDESESYPEELYRDMARLGLFGITTPEALGRARRRRRLLCDRDGGARARLRLGRRPMRARRARRDAAVGARHAGAAGALPWAAARLRAALRLLHHRAGGRLRRVGRAHDGGSRRLGVQAHRREDLDPQRAGRRLRRRPRPHRSGGRQARHVDLPRRRRCVWLRARAQGAQDGPARLAGRRARLQRCRARARGAAWGGGQGLPHDDERARQGPRRHRRARRRHPAGGARRVRSPMPRHGASSGRRSPSSRPCSGSSPTSPRRPTRRAS